MFRVYTTLYACFYICKQICINIGYLVHESLKSTFRYYEAAGAVYLILVLLTILSTSFVYKMKKLRRKVHKILWD